MAEGRQRRAQSTRLRGLFMGEMVEIECILRNVSLVLATFM